MQEPRARVLHVGAVDVLGLGVLRGGRRLFRSFPASYPTGGQQCCVATKTVSGHCQIFSGRNAGRDGDMLMHSKMTNASRNQEASRGPPPRWPLFRPLSPQLVCPGLSFPCEETQQHVSAGPVRSAAWV